MAKDNTFFKNDMNNINKEIDLMNNNIELYKRHILVLTDVNENLSKELEEILDRDEQLRFVLNRVQYLKMLKQENKNEINSSLDNIKNHMRNNGNRGFIVKRSFNDNTNKSNNFEINNKFNNNIKNNEINNTKFNNNVKDNRNIINNTQERTNKNIPQNINYAAYSREGEGNNENEEEEEQQNSGEEEIQNMNEEEMQNSEEKNDGFEQSGGEDNQ